MMYFLMKVEYCCELDEGVQTEKVLVAANSFADAVEKVENYYKSDLEKFLEIEIICAECGGAEEEVLPIASLLTYLKED